MLASISQGNCVDISCYSNKWPSVLGWNPGNKIDQNIRIPTWIRNNKTHIKECLKGLFHTDGSIYYDRGFLMVNFVNCAKMLCEDVFSMIKIIGYKPTISILKSSNYRTKYTIRVAQKSKEFIEDIRLIKKPE